MTKPLKIVFLFLFLFLGSSSVISAKNYDAGNRSKEATALGKNSIGSNNYIVPAILLKYQADKIRNDFKEKGLTKEGVEVLLKKELSTGVKEWLIPHGQYGNAFIKATDNEILVGYIKTVANENKLVVLADKKGIHSLSNKLDNATETEVREAFESATECTNCTGEGVVNSGGDVAIDVANATEKQLDDIFTGLQNTPPFKYAPNTLEHKAERWAQYKIEKGTAAKDYSNWSNIYNSNMTKARTAHQAADDVMASIGWGQREVTVQAGSYTRRMDIADVNLRKAVEVKSYETGKVYATQAIKGELNADKFLVDMQNWQIEWVFKGCEPSQPLRTLLEQAGITIKLVP